MVIIKEDNHRIIFVDVCIRCDSFAILPALSTANTLFASPYFAANILKTPLPMKVCKCKFVLR